MEVKPKLFIINGKHYFFSKFREEIYLTTDYYGDMCTRFTVEGLAPFPEDEAAAIDMVARNIWYPVEPQFTNHPKCIICGKEVTSEDKKIFEGMCWPCFHIHFEHDTSEHRRDEPCDEPNCPLRKKEG